MPPDTVKGILSVPSKPKNDSELVDKKRITAKQALFIRNMCDEISNFMERQPLVFTEARAHRLIEALKPSWEVVVAHQKESRHIRSTLRMSDIDADYEDYGDEGLFGNSPDDSW